MKMIKNILFEVLPIGSYTFFLPVWQFVDATPKKLCSFESNRSSNYFRKKLSAVEQVYVPSMQISGNRTEPSLVNKPHVKVFPNQMPQSFPWPVLLCVVVHYHEAKSLCVTFFDIPVVFHTKLDSICWSFVVGSVQY